MKKEEIFNQELTYIKKEKYKEAAKTLLSLVPDYFYEVQASSTGKYHPAFTLGNGGLVRHTKVAVTIANELLNLAQMDTVYTEDEKDLIIIALLMHDTIKHGDPKEQYVRFDHPLLAANFIKEQQGKTKLTDEDVTFIQKAISSHMGQWNTSTYSDVTLPLPKTKYEKFVHMCDYLASRKFLNVNFNDQNEIEM